MDVQQELASWLRVHTPALWLVTREEKRAVELLRQLAEQTSPPRKVLLWSGTRGLREHETGLDPATLRLTAALDQIHEDMNDGRIIALLDPDLTSPQAARCLRDAANRAGPGTRTLVVISQSFEHHPSLARLFVRLSLPPPDSEALKSALVSAADRYRQLTGSPIRLTAKTTAALAQAALGMTPDECHRAALRILFDQGALGPEQRQTLQTLKCQRVADHPLLHPEVPTADLDDVGGMAAFKEWLRANQALVKGQAQGRRFRGLLMVGLPGCGQAVSVRAAVRTWGLPLLRLDGMALSSGVGAEEVERALAQVEECHPAILWIPRLDAAFNSDGEQGGRAIGEAGLALERWLLDRDRRTVVVATARDPERLPLTMVVRGGFDKTFFLDFPNSDERRQILKIILAKRGMGGANLNIEMLVAASDGFSGAQIVQAIDRGLLENHDEDEPLRMVDLLHSLRQATPMAGYLGDTRRRVKAWAHRWALSVSSPREN